MLKTCTICGRGFIPNDARATMCSNACRKLKWGIAAKVKRDLERLNEDKVPQV